MIYIYFSCMLCAHHGNFYFPIFTFQKFENSWFKSVLKTSLNVLVVFPNVSRVIYSNRHVLSDNGILGIDKV